MYDTSQGWYLGHTVNLIHVHQWPLAICKCPQRDPKRVAVTLLAANWLHMKHWRGMYYETTTSGLWSRFSYCQHNWVPASSMPNIADGFQT
jgi:hypothetical protein